MLPDVYSLVAVAQSDEQLLRAALLWAGSEAIACGRSAGAWYGLEGVSARRPEIAIRASRHARHRDVDVVRVEDPRSLMVREHRGLRVTGPEATIVRLAYLLDSEAFEIACEDARRRRLTSIPSLHAYLEKYARPGQRGVTALRALLRELDPTHPSRSTLEVKTRRLLVASGLRDFVREHPLAWNGRRYYFDFTFMRRRTILETNGRRWHDDANDFERDQEKLSVPGRHGYKLVLASWDKVTRHPRALVDEIRTTLAA
jgi:very-short-patch-repair endonuclease